MNRDVGEKKHFNASREGSMSRLLNGRSSSRQPCTAQRLLSRLITFSFVILASFVPVSEAAATNVYIAQNAAGAGNGADCADSLSVSWFNNSVNWGSGGSQIGPGTVVHLCGTITTTLTVNGSGTSGNVIEILFESGASITVATCNGACLNLGGNSYILIDGGANRPCGWNVATNASEGTCNGVIQDTANGTALANHNADTGISISGSNVEVRNIGIYNIWVSNGTSANSPGTNPQCIGVNTSSNITVHDMVCHDAVSFINGIYGTNISGYNVYNNEVYN
jgi:hypothetical protein